MTLVAGVRCRNTERSGFRTLRSSAGLLTTTATGPTWLPGATPGWMMLPGDLRHSTTAAGYLWQEHGAGYLPRLLWLELPMCGRFMRPHSWPGWVDRTLPPDLL